ncbi:MAG: YtxH domain-containing protein [Balneolales bacterium]|nr:YtxH domain-containing protein [Balneolales bacterium]
MNINGLKLFITASGMLATGLAIGLLLSPKTGRENRATIRKGAHEAGDWMNSQTQNARKKATKVGDNIKKSVKDRVPDLYEATDFHLTDEEVRSVRDTEA